MSEIDIQRQDSAQGGRYLVSRAEGDEVAELSWHNIGPRMIAADHTYTPPAMRGTGVAAAMVERLISDARAQGTKILPLCSYVRAQFDRHPDWADLRLQG